LAPAVRAVVAVVAQVAADPAVRPVPLPPEPEVVAVLPVLLPEVVEGRARLAHKLLPLVRLQVAVVLAPLPPEAEVAALLLVQGLVASESLGSR